jgi:hypothetical protein
MREREGQGHGALLGAVEIRGPTGRPAREPRLLEDGRTAAVVSARRKHAVGGDGHGRGDG